MGHWFPRNPDVRFNAGRKSTRIGGDGIDPYVDLPHPLADMLERLLNERGIEFAVRRSYIVGAPNDHNPMHVIDRFSFPTAPIRELQAVVDLL